MMEKEQLLLEAVNAFSLPDAVVSLFVSYPYPIIFVCLLVGLGIILFPSFYLAVMGVFTWWHIIGIMVLATLIADSFWYFVGRGIIPTFISSRLDHGKYAKKLGEVTEGRELILLFYSKFVYGTRIAVQILCGARKVNYAAFLGINTATVIFLGFLYYGTVRFASSGIDSLGELKHKFVFVLLITFFVLGAFHFILYRLLKGRVFGKV